VPKDLPKRPFPHFRTPYLRYAPELPSSVSQTWDELKKRSDESLAVLVEVSDPSHARLQGRYAPSPQWIQDSICYPRRDGVKSKLKQRKGINREGASELTPSTPGVHPRTHRRPFSRVGRILRPKCTSGISSSKTDYPALAHIRTQLRCRRSLVSAPNRANQL
jgi:hypothetical protein